MMNEEHCLGYRKGKKSLGIDMFVHLNQADEENLSHVYLEF